MEKPILLIDCSYLCYQAYYRLGHLSYRELKTGVIFGFLTRILSLGTFFRTNRLVFLWDSKHSNRKEIDKTYKAHRHKEVSKEEIKKKSMLYKQIRLLRKEILPAIGFQNSFIQRGYEADDLIAVICRDEEDDIIIVTGDDDLLQLLRLGVKIWHPTKKVMMTHTRFTQKYGITPKQWVEVKVLAGCHSDGVKGIPGIGEVSAIKYLQGTLKGKKDETIDEELRRGDTGLRYQLVELPLKGTKHISLHSHEHFDESGFEEVCNEYGFLSLVNEQDEWETLFKVDFRHEA